MVRAALNANPHRDSSGNSTAYLGTVGSIIALRVANHRASGIQTITTRLNASRPRELCPKRIASQRAIERYLALDLRLERRSTVRAVEGSLHSEVKRRLLHRLVHSLPMSASLRGEGHAHQAR